MEFGILRRCMPAWTTGPTRMARFERSRSGYRRSTASIMLRSSRNSNGAPIRMSTMATIRNFNGPNASGDTLMEENKCAALAAAVIMASFGLVAFYLPNIMLAVGSISPAAAGVVAVLFVGAFFLVFWL